MFELNLDTVMVVSSKQRADLLNEEMVILNLDSEKYYVLNKSAAAVWSNLQQAVSWGSILENIADSERDDLKAFLLDLVSAGLLVETDNPVIAREINLSQATNPTLTCMGGMKELVAMAGSAGGTGVGEEDPGTEGVEDTGNMFINAALDASEVLLLR